MCGLCSAGDITRDRRPTPSTDSLVRQQPFGPPCALAQSSSAWTRLAINSAQSSRPIGAASQLRRHHATETTRHLLGGQQVIGMAGRPRVMHPPYGREGGEEFGDPLAGSRQSSRHPHWKCLDPALHQPGFLWGGARCGQHARRTCSIATLTSAPTALTSSSALSACPIRYLMAVGQIRHGHSQRFAIGAMFDYSPGCAGRLVWRYGTSRTNGAPACNPARWKARPLPVPSAAAGGNHLDGVDMARLFQEQRHAPSFGRVRGRWHLSMPLRLRSRPGRSGRARRMPWSAAVPNSICPVCERSAHSRIDEVSLIRR